MKIYNYPAGALGTNCYLGVCETTKEAFIVDPGGVNDRLAHDVEQNAYKVKAIIVTHGHGDHICGVPYYKGMFPDAMVIAAEAEKPMLMNARMNFSAETCGEKVSLMVDRYVNDGDTLKIGKIELLFLMTPGHTPGGMCIYTDGVVFSGDTLFAQSIGRTDFPGGSFAQLKKSIETKLYVLPPETRVLPGHMGPTTIAIEKESNPFV